MHLCRLNQDTVRKAVHEMTRLEVSASTLYKLIHRHGLTRKKIQVAKQRCDLYRGQFMAEIQLHWEQFVWIDETGRAAKDHIRRFTCPEVHSVCSSEQIYSQKLQKLENKSCRLQDSRNSNFSTPWNTQTHKKKRW